LLDVGCGVGFTQTLINRSLASRSYTRIEVSLSIVQWLKENGESRDERFGRMENRLVRRTETVCHEFVLVVYTRYAVAAPVSKQGASLVVFQKLERLVVAVALEVMRKLRTNRARQRRLQPVDLFRNGLQAR